MKIKCRIEFVCQCHTKKCPKQKRPQQDKNLQNILKIKKRYDRISVTKRENEIMVYKGKKEKSKN